MPCDVMVLLTPDLVEGKGSIVRVDEWHPTGASSALSFAFQTILH